MRFRAEKAFFLLRRRYSRRRFDSTSSGGAGDVREHTGSTLMGRYRLDRVISSGGFSVVYAASDLRDGGDIAIKILNRRAGGDDGAVGDRFAHEVAALRSVVHPGVVPILDSWITRAGEPCLAMPFLDGITLRAALGHGPLGAARGYRLLRQMGDALAAIHERGIVHRDLKPENIMLLDAGTDEERPVILDFGTAGLLGRDLELAATTLMAGSFHYMAPERLTGHYSAASDVFSLGVIVLEMLTGKRLSDLKWMFFDAEFRGELRQVLAEALPGIGANDLAERLAPAFDPEPRRRPTSLQPWTESLMRALVYAR
jgi:serine/threonine protein kinase